MQSKEKPKKIKIYCMDQQNSQQLSFNFLLKKEIKTDVRKESRTIDIINLMNGILQNNTFAQQRAFGLDSYSIVPLSSQVSLVEWVPNTKTLKKIIVTRTFFTAHFLHRPLAAKSPLLVLTNTHLCPPPRTRF